MTYEKEPFIKIFKDFTMKEMIKSIAIVMVVTAVAALLLYFLTVPKCDDVPFDDLHNTRCRK